MQLLSSENCKMISLRKKGTPVKTHPKQYQTKPKHSRNIAVPDISDIDDRCDKGATTLELPESELPRGRTVKCTRPCMDTTDGRCNLTRFNTGTETLSFVTEMFAGLGGPEATGEIDRRRGVMP